MVTPTSSGPRTYIGLASSAHDGAIAIVNDLGHVVFAESTERWVQTKRAHNIAPDMPLRAARVVAEYCDRSRDLVLAFSWSKEQKTKLAQTSEHPLRAMPRQPTDRASPVAALLDVATQVAATSDYYKFCLSQSLRWEGCTLEYDLRRLAGWESARFERRFYSHHLTHAASAAFTSSFESAACAVLDGYGESGAVASYFYESGKLREVNAGPPSARTTASLGEFYMDLCDACGFSPMAGEEWKVMGLAAYGKENSSILSWLRRMIVVKGLHLEAPGIGDALRLRAQLRGVSRTPGQAALEVADLARTGQKIFEDVLCEYLENLHAATRSENIVLGGGCALNSAANGKILSSTPFKHLHVCCAPADDGNALGAALLAYQDDHASAAVSESARTPYLGTRMSRQTLAHLRRFGGFRKITDCGEGAPRYAAQLLSRGCVVGWIQGQAEFGPRALGNRSILADARSASIKARLNDQVKFREEFRPFAPSILHEFGNAYFEDYQQSPYMERTLRFRDQVMHLVPGAVHEDGTGRLQTVKREWNPLFHALLSEFHRLTGVPLIINTSYNVMGKPIVHSVEDVIAVFCTSGLDAVFIESIVIEK
jgi:carbamoyltransferase